MGATVKVHKPSLVRDGATFGGSTPADGRDAQRTETGGHNASMERAARFGHTFAGVFATAVSPQARAPSEQAPIALPSAGSSSTAPIQRARTKPGGNPKGRGGKGKKHRRRKGRGGGRSAPIVARPNEPRQSSSGNPLERLLNMSEVHYGRGPDDEPEHASSSEDQLDEKHSVQQASSNEDAAPSGDTRRLHKKVRATGAYLNRPENRATKDYLEGLRTTFQGMRQSDDDPAVPARAIVREITPNAEEHGYYNSHDSELSLGILNPEVAANYEAQGLGTPEENLTGTAVHEYTHVLDLETAHNKPYRQQALQNLRGALPLPSVNAGHAVNQNRIERFQQVGGLLDPHIGLTMGQGMLGRGHTPLLSELMANFAELGASEHPIAHLTNRPSFTQGDNEGQHAYHQRISQDYDTLMQNAVVPYATGLANDPTMAQGVRDFHSQALLQLPTSGAGLLQAMQAHNTDLMNRFGPHLQYAHAQMQALQGDANAQQQLPALKTASLKLRLRDKIREKQEQRKRKT